MPLKVIKPRGSRSIKNYVYSKVGSTTLDGIVCNIMEYVSASKRISANASILYSNWSIAEEVKRLETLEMIRPVQKEYVFHNLGCTNTSTPMDNDKSFMKYGKTKSGSIRHKCKTCGKITNINDNILSNFNYGMKRNDVLLRVLDGILLKAPVTKICEHNEISLPTFYRKLEVIYEKCRQFLDRHEAKLSDIKFGDLYLTSDTFTYALNNIRRKGEGNTKKTNYEKQQATDALTNMNAVADGISNYVFRADICYDIGIRLEDIEEDTKEYHCDHTYDYLKKYQRIQKFSHHPQVPTKHDSQSFVDYQEELAKFDARKKFVEGLHVVKGYTSVAQLHILKKRLKYNRFIFVSDDDKSLQQAVFRVFKDDFKYDEAMYFISSYSKSKKRQDTYAESEEARRKLIQFGHRIGYKKKGVYELAIKKLERDLKGHDFIEYKLVNGTPLPKPTRIPLNHPLPAKDEGKRLIHA